MMHSLRLCKGLIRRLGSIASTNLEVSVPTLKRSNKGEDQDQTTEGISEEAVLVSCSILDWSPEKKSFERGSQAEQKRPRVAPLSLLDRLRF